MLDLVRKLVVVVTLTAALLVPAMANAQSLNTGGTPNFGARSVAPGIAPDPLQIAVTSGGTLNISSMNLGPNCTGFATAQPDFNFTLTGVSAFLRVSVDAGAEDTTLVVNKADGTWVCNDDANGGTNPMLELRNAGPGLYNVWVGSYQSGTRARATLSISSRPASATAQSLNTGGTPNFGARSVAPGFAPDPLQIAVTSGGTLNISSMNLGPGCTGFATAQPDFNLTLTGVSAFLRVSVDAGAEDTTLVVNKADGTWVCNDDANGGTNPMLELRNAGPGLYNVWVGSYRSGTRARGTLSISERPLAGAAVAVPTPVPAGNGDGSGGRPVVASGDARTQLTQIDQVLRQRGYAAVGLAVHGNLAAGGLIAYAVNATPAVCYAIFALGEQPGQDLNLVVTDPSARTIAYDVRPDAHPYAVTCPGVAGRLDARLQMQAGMGGYYYAVYQGPSSSQLDLATFFGGAAAAPAQVQTAQLDPATNERVGVVEQRLAAENYHRVYGPVGLVLSQGQTRQFPAMLTVGVCYAFASFGGQGATDTDISLVDGSGTEIERDVATAADGMVRYCPTAAGSYELKVTMYAGNGPLFTMGYQQGAATQGPAAQVVAATSTAGAGLEENFRLLDADMRARGYEGMGEAQRGQLAASAAREFPIELEGGKCYAILAVGDNGARDLDLRLLERGGGTVDRDVEQNPRPIVRVCPTRSGAYRMQVEMAAGEGNFVYAAYRWPRGIRGPFGLAGLMYVRLAEMTQLLSVAGFQPDADFTPGRGNFRSENEEHTHTIALAAGHCYSVLLVGGDGVNDVDASLLRGNTAVATDDSHNALPSVRHCPEQNGNFTLKVKATSGSGTYFYQLFTQTQ